MNNTVDEHEVENNVRKCGFELKAKMLSAYPEYDGGKVLKKAKWKAVKISDTLEGLPVDKEDLVQDYLLKIWQKRDDYNPKTGTRSAFAGGIIEGCAKNDYRDILNRNTREGTSMDAPIADTKADSAEKTHADVHPDESALLPTNLRGARRIRVETDIRLAMAWMTKVDWTIFSLRWKFGVSHADLAKELHWTENKLRWYLKKYEKRYAAFFGLKRSRH